MKFFLLIFFLILNFEVFSNEKIKNLVENFSFDELLGKNLERWNHLDRKEDFELIQRYKDLYLKNKKLQFLPNSTIFKIPKIVHFVWIGPKNFPIDSIKNIRTWQKYHPDWTFYFWTDIDREPPISGMKKRLIKDFRLQKSLKKMYDKYPNYGAKSDILRFAILYEEGGVYADHDANAKTSFENLNKAYDFYCCLEVPQIRASGFATTVGAGLIGAKSKHIVMKKTLEFLEKRQGEVEKKYSLKTDDHMHKIILNLTYLSLTFGVWDSIDKNNNVDMVFPASYFFAVENLPRIYSKHFFGNAWLEDKDNKISQNDLRIKISKINKSFYKSFKFLGFSFFIIVFMSLFLFIKLKKEKV